MALIVSKNANQLEEQFRNAYPFSDLIISFPTKNFIPDIRFAAYLKSFKDGFSQTWNSEDAYGRMDQINSYQNTKRSFSVTFAIPSNNAEDAKEHMETLRILVKNMYPGYIKNGSQYIIDSPPLFRIKFANLLYNAMNPEQGILFKLTSEVSLEYKIEEYGAHILNSENIIIPKYMEITLTGDVLHEHTVGWDSETSKFIPEQQSGNSYPFYVKNKKGKSASKPTVAKAASVSINDSKAENTILEVTA